MPLLMRMALKLPQLLKPSRLSLEFGEPQHAQLIQLIQLLQLPPFLLPHSPMMHAPPSLRAKTSFSETPASQLMLLDQATSSFPELPQLLRPEVQPLSSSLSSLLSFSFLEVSG